MRQGGHAKIVARRECERGTTHAGYHKSAVQNDAPAKRGGPRAPASRAATPENARLRVATAMPEAIARWLIGISVSSGTTEVDVLNVTSYR